MYLCNYLIIYIIICVCVYKILLSQFWALVEQAEFSLLFLLRGGLKAEQTRTHRPGGFRGACRGMAARPRDSQPGPVCQVALPSCGHRRRVCRWASEDACLAGAGPGAAVGA